MVRRFFGDPLEQFRHPEEEPWFDVMQVCVKGHKITEMLKSSPEFAKDFCPQCGSGTISKCRKCGKDIPGYYHVPNVISDFDTPVPSHCAGCGSPFPWYQAKQREKLSLAAQKALEGLERQLERLYALADECDADDPRFVAWRDTTRGLFERFLRGSPHTARFNQIKFRPSLADELSANEVNSEEVLRHGLQMAEQCLISAIEEVENFDITVTAGEKGEEGSMGPGTIQQVFHGPVTIYAQQLAAAEKAVQELRQTNTDLSRTFGDIARLLRESQELKGPEVREGFEAIEVLSSEMQKGEEKRNWQRILDYAHKLLGVIASATDIAAKLAPYASSLGPLIEQAKRFLS